MIHTYNKRIAVILHQLLDECEAIVSVGDNQIKQELWNSKGNVRGMNRNKAGRQQRIDWFNARSDAAVEVAKTILQVSPTKLHVPPTLKEHGVGRKFF